LRPIAKEMLTSKKTNKQETTHPRRRILQSLRSCSYIRNQESRWIWSYKGAKSRMCALIRHLTLSYSQEAVTVSLSWYLQSSEVESPQKKVGESVRDHASESCSRCITRPRRGYQDSLRAISVAVDSELIGYTSWTRMWRQGSSRYSNFGPPLLAIMDPTG